MSEAEKEQISQLKDFIKFARSHLSYEGVSRRLKNSGILTTTEVCYSNRIKR